ncbi:hypothetical protein ACFVIN_09125, partial [Streptomyces prasinus]
MTVFIMVAGVFTGVHVWQETAARLVAAGNEAHAVPLTGVVGGGPPPPGPPRRGAKKTPAGPAAGRGGPPP